MRLNWHTEIVGRSATLVPYRNKHVPQYHVWMQDPVMQELTGSEPLSLEEEYANQVSWQEDETKLTFIILDHSLGDTPTMAGDVNLFLTEHEDEEGKYVAELEIMIAEPRSRRKGLARGSHEIRRCTSRCLGTTHAAATAKSLSSCGARCST
mmetsp:Transcript_3678/g.6251  ORF Transcript_3678/g.6251 Transcript_3678/m.6251 type:complete len:152 (-) Transcript_3678:641-1096(-)